MQYVRCDACGAKALFAASRCPKCTHAFFLRNHRGDMVPLAHCRKCDTWYPRSVGGCKWCGTKPAPAAISPTTFIIAGAVAVAIAALVYFRGFQRRAAAGGDVLSSVTDSVAVAPPPVAASPIADSAAPDSLKPDTQQVATPTPAAVAVTTAPVVATVPPPPGSTRPVTAQWTPATALTYINVRADADRKAPVVGVVTPAMKVELGARLRGWRQVKAPGISGWVDPRNFASDSGATPR